MPRFEYENISIWYDKFGIGPHAVLMIPGAIGTSQSDFNEQLNLKSKYHLDQSKFTFVCVELVGWGVRTDERRRYGSDVLQNDAKCCHRLMTDELGYQQYSVLGWSEGSKVALIIGRQFGSDQIRSLVLLSVMSFASPYGTDHLLWSRNIDNWDQNNLVKYIDAYGGDRERVANLWSAHMDFIAIYGKLYPGNVLGPIQNGLARLEPPVLVLHGDKDFFVELDQPQLLERWVPDCQLVRFPNGSHCFHQEQPEKFKIIVEQFLESH